MTTYKEVFQLAQEKGCTFLKCKHCGNIELNCLKDGWCASCFPYEETPTTQWAKSIDSNLLILTLIQKWLRDEYNYRFKIEPTINGMDSFIHDGFCWKWVGEYSTDEQALMEGINEALKLL